MQHPENWKTWKHYTDTERGQLLAWYAQICELELSIKRLRQHVSLTRSRAAMRKSRQALDPRPVTLAPVEGN